MTLEHVAIWTDNLEELSSYYVKVFGGQLSEKYTNSEKQFSSYFVTFAGGARIELMTMAGIKPNTNRTKKLQQKGITHIAFGVASMAEVDAKAKELASLGYPILTEPRITGDGFYEFETLDPEGNRLEVTCTFSELMGNRKALLVIDMQVGLFTPSTPRFDANGVIRRINSLSKTVRDNGDLVIFIQHDGTSESYLIPGTPEWEILPSLTSTPSDIIVTKTANDAFYNSNLQEVLDNNGITELIVTGCATDFCVDTTIRSALAKNYKITVVEDGHTTGNRPYLDAQSVIAHHNWIWSELSATAHKVKVIPFNEIFVEE